MFIKFITVQYHNWSVTSIRVFDETDKYYEQTTAYQLLNKTGKNL